MKTLSLQMGYEIKTAAGPVLKPTEIKIWDQSSRFSEFTPQAPFKFMNDALIGLTFHKMNGFKNLTFTDRVFAEQSLKALDPYFELYQKSAAKLKPITNAVKIENPKNYALACENFEKQFSDFWDQTITQAEISFQFFGKALAIINSFEDQLGAPFIYNFSVKFSESFTEKLVCFYSLLFHLRTVIALDHNAHVEDTVFETLKCDSITDYLPKADFTTNDAMLYWQFKKLSTPFVGHKDRDVRIEKLFVDPLERAFFQYNHNACALIDQLPKSLLTSSSQTELEEVLHCVQMDWLLGTGAGLLFRLREEAYGVVHGYDNVFWADATMAKNKKSSSLKICFELNEADVFTQKSAA